MIKHVIFPVFLVLFIGLNFGEAQSLKHPIIWTTAEDREDVLKHIEDNDWAQDFLANIERLVDGKATTHQTNPRAILNTIPEIADGFTWYGGSESIRRLGDHYRILSVASMAGELYHLTEDEKYAQYAADILAFYMDELAPRTPQTTSIAGDYFGDPRTTTVHFAIAYDFIYNFLKKPDTKVYNMSVGGMIPFDNAKAQKAIKNMLGNALQEYGGADKHGKFVSNHPVLTAPGVLFLILCVEDDTERERLFDVFWNKGTKNQNSFTKTLLPMFGSQGIWPEGISYSFMPYITLVLNIVDRLKPELMGVEQNMHILEGNLLFDNLRNPDNRFVRYGDGKRNNDETEQLYLYTLNIAERKGFTDLAARTKVALRQGYDRNGGEPKKVSGFAFDNYEAFERLFWYEDVPKDVSEAIDFKKPTVIIEHAGLALQRNFVEKDNADYGLCGIIGGAHYVHSHVTGIAMELYGAGYIMAQNGGLPHNIDDRKIPTHTEYFWRHAGQNTMIVNGTTHGRQEGSWNSNSYLWQNTTVNVAAEPKHLKDPINKNFSFATQFLDDEVNNDQQQRTLSTIRTSPTSGYYFDLFRSKSLDVNNFHDYIYHNIGDATNIFGEDDQVLSVTATNRYQNDIGDLRKSPGWRFFENTEVTKSTDEAVHIRFDVDVWDRAMHMFLPEGVNREYTKAVGPATREAINGYVDKKTQIMAIRQQGEAWKKPYVVVLEPSIGKASSVQSVEHLYTGTSIVGAKVTSLVGEKEIVDYVICNEDADMDFEMPEIELTFNGRFAIARLIKESNKMDTVLYVGEGTSLTFGAKRANIVLNIKEQSVVDIQVFPNPANEILNINPGSNQKGSYRLYTLSGSVVKGGSISGLTTIELNEFKGGVYLLEVITENARSVRKVVIAND